MCWISLKNQGSAFGITDLQTGRMSSVLTKNTAGQAVRLIIQGFATLTAIE